MHSVGVGPSSSRGNRDHAGDFSARLLHADCQLRAVGQQVVGLFLVHLYGRGMEPAESRQPEQVENSPREHAPRGRSCPSGGLQARLRQRSGRPEHRMRLPRPRLAIGEQCARVALKKPAEQRRGECVECQRLVPARDDAGRECMRLAARGKRAIALSSPLFSPSPLTVGAASSFFLPRAKTKTTMI